MATGFFTSMNNVLSGGFARQQCVNAAVVKWHFNLPEIAQAKQTYTLHCMRDADTGLMQSMQPIISSFSKTPMAAHARIDLPRSVYFCACCIHM